MAGSKNPRHLRNQCTVAAHASRGLQARQNARNSRSKLGLAAINSPAGPHRPAIRRLTNKRKRVRSSECKLLLGYAI
jgi:DNA-binding NarL/FixJ family response regulator